MSSVFSEVYSCHTLLNKEKALRMKHELYDVSSLEEQSVS